jgi:hypothetical protein
MLSEAKSRESGQKNSRRFTVHESEEFTEDADFSNWTVHEVIAERSEAENQRGAVGGYNPPTSLNEANITMSIIINIYILNITTKNRKNPVDS